jgi:hypothetical protein
VTWDDFWRLKWLERYPLWIQIIIGVMIAAVLYEIAF